MRKAVYAIVGLSLAVWARNSLDWDQLMLPFRAAKLYTRPADRFIAMPVVGVAKAKVADTWHAPRPGNRKHEGQDIFARLGTPVISATDGIVIRTPEGGLGGKAVFVLGRGGHTYYYAHLHGYKAGLRVGDMVMRGDVLGFVGNTGNARGTPPHLHFGVYSPSGALNPLPMIDQAAAAD
jgi:murein DD-endopeptidase MepM/ murein hydrolase activator NlpD